jgi:hypothetical protein
MNKKITYTYYPLRSLVKVFKLNVLGYANRKKNEKSLKYRHKYNMTTPNIVKTQRTMALNDFLIESLYTSLGLTADKLAILGITPGGNFNFTKDISEPLFKIEETDATGRYALIHYTANGIKWIDSSKDITDAQREILQSIKDFRGLIVDTKAEPGLERVCPSFGYTPTCARSNLTLKGTTLDITDSNGSVYSLDWEKNNVKINQAFEGTLLRIWRRGGLTRMSTHHRIDGTNSRFGDIKQPLFSELFKQLGGNTDDLFDEAFADSPFVYYFILCAPPLMMTSRMDVGRGCLVFVECVTTVPADIIAANPDAFTSFESSPKFNDTIRSGKLLFKTLDSLTDTGDLIVPIPPPNYDQDQNVIYQSTSLQGTSEQVLAVANTILTAGYSSGNDVLFNDEGALIIDRHYLPGESLIVTYYNESGNRCMLKVMSPANLWRQAVRGNTPNLSLRYYQLCDLSVFSVDETAQQIANRAAYDKNKETMEYFTGNDSIQYNYAQLIGEFPIPTPEDLQAMAAICDVDPSWPTLPPSEYTTADGTVHKLAPFNATKVDVWPDYKPKAKGQQVKLDPSDPRYYRRLEIIMSLFMSVPLYQRSEVLRLFDKYEQGTDDIINFIANPQGYGNIDLFFDAIGKDENNRKIFFDVKIDKEGGAEKTVVKPKNPTKRMINIWQQATVGLPGLKAGARTDQRRQALVDAKNNVVSYVRRERSETRYAMVRNINRYLTRDTVEKPNVDEAQ